MRKRALFIVDVQPQTLVADGARALVGRIQQYIVSSSYDLYVLATYSAPAESMFAKQGDWILAVEQAGPTDSSVTSAVQSKPGVALSVTKTVRSVLKCEQHVDLVECLSDLDIGEIHLVGFDINDCVLATAYDAVDQNFYTFVLEDLCGRHDGDQRLIDAALAVLRCQDMTKTIQL